MIFDCSLLTIEELKGAFEELRNSPSLCDTDIDHVITVYREKKSEANKAERDRKSKWSITSEGRPKSHQKEKKTLTNLVLPIRTTKNIEKLLNFCFIIYDIY